MLRGRNAVRYASCLKVTSKDVGKTLRTNEPFYINDFWNRFAFILV